MPLEQGLLYDIRLEDDFTNSVSGGGVVTQVSLQGLAVNDPSLIGIDAAGNDFPPNFQNWTGTFVAGHDGTGLAADLGEDGNHLQLTPIGGGDFSVAGYFYLDGTAFSTLPRDGASLFCDWSVMGRNFMVTVPTGGAAAGKLCMFSGNGSDSQSTFLEGPVFPTDQWVHVIAKRTNDIIQLYLNGIEVASKSGVMTGGDTSYISDAVVNGPHEENLGLNYWGAHYAPATGGADAYWYNLLGIGGHSYDWYRFPGKIDKVLIYNRALSENEVIELHNNNGENPQGENNMTTRSTRSRIDLKTQLDDEIGGADLLGSLQTHFLRRDGKSIVPDGVLPKHAINKSQVGSALVQLMDAIEFAGVQHDNSIDSDQDRKDVNLGQFEADFQSIIDLGTAGSSWKAPLSDFGEWLIQSPAWEDGDAAFCIAEGNIVLKSSIISIENIMSVSALAPEVVVDNGDGTFTVTGADSGAVVMNAGDVVGFPVEFANIAQLDGWFQTKKAELDASLTAIKDDFLSYRTTEFFPGRQNGTFDAATARLDNLKGDMDDAATYLTATLTEIFESKIVEQVTTYNNAAGVTIALSADGLARGGRVEVYLRGLRLQYDPEGVEGGYRFDDAGNPTEIQIPAGLGHEDSSVITVIYEKAMVSANFAQ